MTRAYIQVREYTHIFTHTYVSVSAREQSYAWGYTRADVLRGITSLCRPPTALENIIPRTSVNRLRNLRPEISTSTVYMNVLATHTHLRSHVYCCERKYKRGSYAIKKSQSHYNFTDNISQFFNIHLVLILSLIRYKRKIFLLAIYCVLMICYIVKERRLNVK